MIRFLFHKVRKHTISFKHAFAGLFWALKTQPNYQIHFLCSLFAIGGALLLQISRIEFLIILALVFFGFALETVNTAIESTNDAISTGFKPEIKNAKDSAAAAVLIFAFGAVVIACYIFLPRLYTVLIR